MTRKIFSPTAEERLAEHTRILMNEYGADYLIIALIDAARGRGAKLASICGMGPARAEAIQADLGRPRLGGNQWPHIGQEQSR